MNITDAVFGFIFCIILVIFYHFAHGMGYYSARDTAVASCEMSGKFKLGDDIYSCRKIK
jgi:hypothetical protein